MEDSTKDPIAALEDYAPDPGSLWAPGWTPFDERWDGAGPMPMQKTLFHGALPSLDRIHPRRWAEVMAPYDRAKRQQIAWCQGLSPKEIAVAQALLDRLPPPAQTLALNAARAATVPAAPELAAPVRARPRGRRACRQVNIRLTLDEYDDLMTAADVAGTTPTTLARWLLLGGARRTLRDHAGAYSEARSRS